MVFITENARVKWPSLLIMLQWTSRKNTNKCSVEIDRRIVLFTLISERNIEIVFSYFIEKCKTYKDWQYSTVLKK